MPPLVLALIDAVLSLAYYHDERGRRGQLVDHDSVTVRAELRGPELDEPAPGGLELRVTITLVPRSEEREVSEEQVRFYVDLQHQRLLAGELTLAELPLDRTGFASLLGALEAWCYERIPLERPL
ncbi:MAG: hypothetical protein R6X02_20625 [Enhygromyxa sp.]